MHDSSINDIACGVRLFPCNAVGEYPQCVAEVGAVLTQGCPERDLVTPAREDAEWAFDGWVVLILRSWKVSAVPAAVIGVTEVFKYSDPLIFRLGVAVQDCVARILRSWTVPAVPVAVIAVTEVFKYSAPLKIIANYPNLSRNSSARCWKR